MESWKADGKQAMVNVKTGEKTCIVLRDSIIRNIRVDKSDMKVECFWELERSICMQ
jgi:hypothetical protein